ncbi:hypothetical protein K490DRAFT_65801 [Saccharata proteae CBS 121410]|uniref:Uncharacterized protein n=1 Tax=Saccharata proteae CBS 121410 TaxID=1314787 RepID=A0A9P4HX00_9PEZI|nr:hypothetical protein K490DRAFT_65801 [Saccharata proteae CBS 121410]
MPNVLADVLDDLLGPGSRDRSPSRGYNDQDWDWENFVAFESGSPEQESAQYQTEPSNHASANASDFTVNSNPADTATAAAGNRDSFLAHILNTSDDRHSSPQAPGRLPSPPLRQPRQPANASNEPPRPDDNFTTSRLSPARTPPLSEERSTLHALHPSSPNMPPKAGSSKKRKADDAGASRSAKHVKHGASEVTKSKHATKRLPDTEIEKIDLANDDKIEDVLKKQREEQVKAQAPPAENPTKLSNITCVICMDTPKDLTATSCGKSP